MKKKWKVILCVVLAAVVVLIGLICAHREPEVDMNEMVTVYCISEIRYSPDGKEPRLCESFQYDAQGNMLSHTFYNYFDGSEERTYTLEYDARGNCTRAPNGAGGEYVRSYDADDRLLTYANVYKGKERWKHVYAYDEAGRKTTETYYFDGEESWKESYTYDDQGNLIQTEKIRDGIVIEKIVRTFDFAGRELSAIGDPIIGDPYAEKYAVYRKYDIRGNVISYRYYRGDTLAESVTKRYDLFGRLKFTETMEYGKLSYQATCFYDWRGYLVREECLMPPEIYIEAYPPVYEVVYTFKYDKKGNLVERVKDHGEKMGKDYFSWVYDERGNMLVSEAYGYRTERTYDEWDNVLTNRRYSDTGELMDETFYTYVSFQVPRWLAEKIWEQQKCYLDTYDGMG